APELYLKRLLVGGFEKIYEIGRCFRNEGIDYAHNPEFTMMEMYWAYVSGEKYIAFLEEMLRYALHAARGENLRVVIEGREVDFAAPWKKTTFYDAISEASGIDVKSLSTPQDLIKEVKAKKIKADFSGCHGMGEYLDALYKATARPQMTEPTWVYDYPLDLKPLARQHTQEKQLSASVQLVVCGAEIINAYYHELNDPEDQKNRFLAQQELREKGSEEAQWMDEDFIAALELGMPPAAGMGVGIDRLAAMITESPNLKEVILFPTLRPKQ
ncbi:lysine--tRNA ligase, partial [bacterium]|nr:lysine--tRNA ligase [bacterium]